MALGGGNPISGEAARLALQHDLIEAGRTLKSAESRAELDAEELRELEHAAYYPEAATPDAAPAPVRRRSLLDWLLRRP